MAVARRVDSRSASRALLERQALSGCGQDHSAPPTHRWSGPRRPKRGFDRQPRRATPNVSWLVRRQLGVIPKKRDLASEIEEIYAKRYHAFCRMAWTVTGSVDAAHDAVQEGFARSLAHAAEFRHDGPLEGWVWRIILRVALDSRRNGRRVRGESEGDATSSAFELPYPERDPELVDAVRSLSERQRLVVFLRYFADLSHADIAAVTGMQLGTVSATLSQAKASLARRLAIDESTYETKELVQ